VTTTAAGSLEKTAARLDAFTAWVGRIVSYLGVATVLICFATVYLRYALGIGYVWLQESYIWTHCAAIMFGSSYAILQGGFVRVDMFYNRMSARAKAWVDLFGTFAFLAPFLLMMAVSGWSFFLSSWKMSERSAYESGMPAVYLRPVGRPARARHRAPLRRHPDLAGAPGQTGQATLRTPRS
jgi:TRAP-type mannitol/chloroaromatic compound transport system permease small subunit